MSSTVIVSNIALSTAENTISEFFSFCGKITALKVSPAADGQSLTAYITFESQSASKTSLLLSNALINDCPITVQPAPEEVTQQLAAEPAAAANPNIVNKPHEVPAELRVRITTYFNAPFLLIWLFSSLPQVLLLRFWPPATNSPPTL